MSLTEKILIKNDPHLRPIRQFFLSETIFAKRFFLNFFFLNLGSIRFRNMCNLHNKRIYLHFCMNYPSLLRKTQLQTSGQTDQLQSCVHRRVSVLLIWSVQCIQQILCLHCVVYSSPLTYVYLAIECKVCTYQFTSSSLLFTQCWRLEETLQPGQCGIEEARDGQRRDTSSLYLPLLPWRGSDHLPVYTPTLLPFSPPELY